MDKTSYRVLPLTVGCMLLLLTTAQQVIAWPCPLPRPPCHTCTETGWESNCTTGQCCHNDECVECPTVSSVSSDDYACVYCDVTFTANVSENCSCVDWSGGGDPESGSGCTFETQWDEPGIYTVVATACEEENSASKDITVVDVNLDISGVDDDDELDPGGYVGLNGDRETISLSIEPVSLSSGTVKLDITSGTSKIEVWDALTGGNKVIPDGPNYYKTWTVDSQPDTLYVKGIATGASELELSFTNGTVTCEDRIKVTVYSLEATWETYPDNVVEDPDHGPNITIDDNPNTGEGKRIFPGKKCDDDTTAEAAMRKKVRVKVTITPAIDNKRIYFSWWDVDDPSTDEPPIDTNGSTGNDNKGSGETLSATQAVTNGSGEARVTFTVAMQPGDNYKIAASINQTKLNEMTQPKADGQESLPDAVVLSDMLTTWRKLWIERDYMAPVPSTGGEMNRVLGTADSCTYNQTAGETTVDLGRLLPYWFDDIDQFEGGWLKFTDSGNTYPVISSTHNLLFDDEVVVTGNCSTESDKSYILFDDDNQNLFNSPYYCILDTYEAAFREAYIDPTYLPSTYSDQVNFNLNLTGLEVSTGVDYDNEQDVWSSSSFWACLIVSCYQPGTSTDMDPDGYGPSDPEEDNEITMGAVPEENDNAIAIFVETIQDYVPSLETRGIAHEVGHSGGGEHSDGGLMSDDLGWGNFTDTTLNTFRSHATWLTTN